MSDLLQFCEESNEVYQERNDNSWKILVVDDEEQIHAVTRMVLKDFSFNNRKLDIVDAYSAKEAYECLQKNSDFSVILLDVVMEDEDAGLKLIPKIRDNLGLCKVRIILRTGQPGQAPEERVIIDYDINDYWAKTDLTSQKLVTSIITSLRSYSDLNTIEMNRVGLNKIIEASTSIFDLQTKKGFVKQVLDQIIDIVKISISGGMGSIFAACIAGVGDKFTLILSTGSQDIMDDKMLVKLGAARKNKSNIFSNDYYIAYLKSKTGHENLFYIGGLNNPPEWIHSLFDVFFSNVSVAFDNLYLNENLEDTQRELIYKMTSVIETRSKETGNHIRRVSDFSKLIALKLGMPEEEAELIKLASAMHDIGKIGVPDSILNKPEKLDKEEFDIMKKHSQLGYEILKSGNKNLFNIAATIAISHHERWDGNGYPSGLKGEEIPIYGRITAIADVFDALYSDRVYRKGMTFKEVLDYIKCESGKQFDPKIIEMLTLNPSDLMSIYGDS